MHSTSTHVLREWKRIVEGGCADVLNILRERPGDIAEVQAKLTAGFGGTPRQASRILIMVTGDGPLDSTLEIRARRFLRFESKKLFNRSIDTVRDGSECGLVRNAAHQDENGRWTLVARCKKDDKICRQDDFLGGERSRAEAAAQALIASVERPADVKMGKQMLKMLPVARDRKGSNCYWKTGDISIALECGVKEVILSSDRSFAAIAPALGLSVHVLKATSPGKSSLTST
jgi:hypothetical protein